MEELKKEFEILLYELEDTKNKFGWLMVKDKIWGWIKNNATNISSRVEPEVGMPSENSFGQWIDVKDKLPSYGEKVLVDIDNGYVILTGIRNTNGWSAFYRDGECLVNRPPEVNSMVTKWMPLPKL